MNLTMIALLTHLANNISYIYVKLFILLHFIWPSTMYSIHHDFLKWKCREERESPQVWSHICVQKLAELAKESTTMRRVLDPMLSYFDKKKEWPPRHGLALLVLSDMAYPEKISGMLFIL